MTLLTRFTPPRTLTNIFIIRNPSPAGCPPSADPPHRDCDMSLSASNVDSPLNGTYIASPAKCMVYGKGSRYSLPDLIAKLGGSKVFVVTGTSLYEKTPVIKEIEGILGKSHVSTFSKIGQHAPIACIQKAVETAKESGADIILSVGGGSPIDAAKAIAFFLHQESGRWIPSIAVPTTLSAAETTQIAGYTNHDGKKIAAIDPELVPKAVLYDGELALYTPTKLWTSTGIRALDHAIELLYHPFAPEIPTKRLALTAITDLFNHLPISASDTSSADTRQILFLAAYASLFPFLFTGGVLFTGGSGLSHSIGNTLGAKYNIPHGITSCLTLAAVVHLKAGTKPDEARQIARAVEAVGRSRTGDTVGDARVVGDAIAELVYRLGHKTTLTECGVQLGQEEAIGESALPNGRKHPDFEAVTKIICDLY